MRCGICMRGDERARRSELTFSPSVAACRLLRAKLQLGQSRTEGHQQGLSGREKAGQVPASKGREPLLLLRQRCGGGETKGASSVVALLNSTHLSFAYRQSLCSSFAGERWRRRQRRRRRALRGFASQEATGGGRCGSVANWQEQAEEEEQGAWAALGWWELGGGKRRGGRRRHASAAFFFLSSVQHRRRLWPRFLLRQGAASIVRVCANLGVVVAPAPLLPAANAAPRAGLGWPPARSMSGF